MEGAAMDEKALKEARVARDEVCSSHLISLDSSRNPTARIQTQKYDR